jgi:hypothetical protein
MSLDKKFHNARFLQMLPSVCALVQVDRTGGINRTVVGWLLRTFDVYMYLQRHNGEALRRMFPLEKRGSSQKNEKITKL